MMTVDMSDYVYKCSQGESFDSVALQVYGDEMYAAELMNANPEKSGLTVFEGGEYLYLPVIEVIEEEDAVINTSNQATAPWRE